MFNRIGELLKAFGNAFSIPELRKRLLFTGLLLLVYRLGGHIPLPGIDTRALADLCLVLFNSNEFLFQP